MTLELINPPIVADLISIQSKENPTKIGLEYEGAHYTYTQMNERSNRAADAFASLGVGSGDRIAWLANNLATFWDAMFGAAKIGAVLTPINWRLAPAEIVQILSDSNASLFVAEEGYAKPFSSIDGFSPPATYLLNDGGDRCFDKLIDESLNSEPGHRPDPRDAFLQLYTSGTTGAPKGVVLTHRGFHEAGASGAESDVLIPQSRDEVMLHALPHFHVAGVNFGVMAIQRSLPIRQHRQFNPAAIVEEAQTGTPLNVFLVPVMIMMILEAAKTMKLPLDNIVHVSYGAAPMPEDLLNAAMAAMPNAKFTQFYGMTETTGGLSTLGADDHAAGKRQRTSAGRPLSGCVVKICDPSTGGNLGRNETGEIVTKSNYIMDGYWNRPDATSEVIKDGWYWTGDAGYFDENGFLYVVDRIKDMIISGGENIYPAEIENLLSKHPGIADVAVIGVPDEKWGEAVKVVVVKAAGAALDESEIREFLEEKLASFKLPKHFQFIDALPRNPSGKILKTQLRKMHKAAKS